MDNWVTLSENLFSLKFMVFRSGLACHAVITSVGGVRVLGDLQGMVFRHKTLHFTAELIGQENISGNLQQ